MSAIKEPLTVQQRKFTRKAHTTSNVLVAGKLLLVLTDKTLYAKAISCFYPVLSAIETKLLAHADRAELQSFVELVKAQSRAAALQRDLLYFFGEDWRSHLYVNSAVETYLKVLDEVEATDPILLSAYFYGLYVALASGGQILKHRIKKFLQLPEADVLHFFAFSGGAVDAKVAIKAAFDGLGERCSPEQQQQLLQESARMFQLNNQIMSSFPVGSDAVYHFVYRVATSWYFIPAMAVGAAALSYLLRSR